MEPWGYGVGKYAYWNKNKDLKLCKWFPGMGCSDVYQSCYATKDWDDRQWDQGTALMPSTTHEALYKGLNKSLFVMTKKKKI